MSFQSGDDGEVDEPNTIGLSAEGHARLKRLKEDGYFGEMRDAYKFAVALALAHGGIASELRSTVTIFNKGTLDRDGALLQAVSALRDKDLQGEPVYKTVERLAEWGVEEVFRRAMQGTLSFREIFGEVEARLKETPSP